MSKEAMKLALEALEGLEALLLSMGLTHLIVYGDAEKAINNLQESLAEQPAQQEPVAVVSGYYGGKCVILPIDPARILNSNTALYTTPPPCPTCEALARTVMLDQTSHDAQRKPLTDEELVDVASNCGMNGLNIHGYTFARAIEAAHGIRGEK